MYQTHKSNAHLIEIHKDVVNTESVFFNKKVKGSELDVYNKHGKKELKDYFKITNNRVAS